MRALRPLAPLFLVAAFLFSCAKPDSQPVAVRGMPAPDFKVKDINGKPISLSSLKGDVVLVNFWATWCGSCKEEKPYMHRLYNLMENNHRFHMVTILFRDDLDSARLYMSRNSCPVPVYSDPGAKAYRKYGLTGVPESFIIDKQGVLREKVIGPLKWDSPEVVAYFEKLLAE